MKRNIIIAVVFTFISVLASIGYYFDRTQRFERTSNMLSNLEEIKANAKRAINLSEKALDKAIEEQTIKMAEKAKRLAQQAQKREWIARTVMCPKCKKRFEPHLNKAPMLKSVLAGAGSGAALGGTTGAYAGAGTGLAVGGVGAFPGSFVGGIIGAIGGGVTGGMGAAWYRDRRVICPSCGKVFKNPKN